MTQNTFIREIEAYCLEANQKPSTVCVRAIGNSRFYERLIRRGQKIEEDMAAIRAYMRANPPRQKAEDGEAA